MNVKREMPQLAFKFSQLRLTEYTKSLSLSLNLLYNNSMPTTTQHIPDELIEHSLALCGKTMEDMNKITLHRPLIIKESFSIEKFAYYLLSEDFIDQYTQNTW